MRTWIIPILGLMAVALASSSFVTPWWTVQEQGRVFMYPYNATYEFTPFGYSYTSVTTGGWSLHPNQSVTRSGDYANLTNMGAVFLTGGTSGAAGTACAVAAFLLASVPRFRTRAQRQATLLGILGFALLLGSAIYLMVALPPAANADLYPPSRFLYGSNPVVSGFWGTGLAGGIHSGAAVSYGPGWAWYALAVAAGLMLADSLLLLRSRSGPGAVAHDRQAAA